MTWACSCEVSWDSPKCILHFLDASQFYATSPIPLAITLNDQIKKKSKLRNVTPGGYNALSEFLFIFKRENKTSVNGKAFVPFLKMKILSQFCWANMIFFGSLAWRAFCFASLIAATTGKRLTSAWCVEIFFIWLSQSAQSCTNVSILEWCTARMLLWFESLDCMGMCYLVFNIWHLLAVEPPPPPNDQWSHWTNYFGVDILFVCFTN